MSDTEVSASSFSVTLMGNLAKACARAGIQARHIHTLSQRPERMRFLSAWLQGRMEMKPAGRQVATALTPQLAGHCKVLEHNGEHPVDLSLNEKLDLLSVDGLPVSHALDALGGEDTKHFHATLKDVLELEGRSPLNACICFYLLEHPALIPESWKGLRVLFWGTVYRDEAGNRDLIRDLCYDKGEWFSGLFSVNQGTMPAGTLSPVYGGKCDHCGGSRYTGGEGMVSMQAPQPCAKCNPDGKLPMEL